MGGDTFANTQRLNRVEFASTKQFVSDILIALGKDVILHWCSPKEVGDKESFGDIDFIVTLNDGEIKRKEFCDLLAEKICALEVSNNSEHLSFLSPERFQIDVLLVPLEEFECSKGFYSNGDFSYCLGKMIYKHNLKWSSKGLSYRIERPNIEQLHNVSNADLEMVLTRSTVEAFKFLGFSDANVEKLTDDSTEISQDELITILGQCRFYSEFLRNSNARKRLFNKHRERRPMVRAFFDHCEKEAEAADQMSMLTGDGGINDEAAMSSQSTALPPPPLVTEEELWDYFNLKGEKEKLMKKFEEKVEKQKLQKKAKEKFNGKHLHEWIPELSNKDFTKFFKRLKENILSKYENAEYDEWILNNEESVIKDECLKTFSQMNNSHT